MKFFIPLVIFILFTSNSFSQRQIQGYIIKLNGDTIKGTIKRPSAFSNMDTFIFYDSLGKKEKIKVVDMIGYGGREDSGQADYTKFKVSSHDLFGGTEYALLKNIIRGKISVFCLNWYEDKTDLYLKTKDEKIYILKYNLVIVGYQKGVLEKAFADCPLVVEKIKGIVGKKKVLELITEYNNCETATTN